jgi:transposase
MRSRAYASIAVNDVDPVALARGREGQNLVVGLDIGKYRVLATARWPDGALARPWRVANPGAIPELVERLRALRQGRQLVVALEPSGTYGDALRQALHDAGIAVQRVSPKAAHDYAEIFDGVPSQHDGKDAGVIAELAALGKGRPWDYQPRSAFDQELAYWVARLHGQQRIATLGLGVIEALLARHWPEATRHLAVASGTVLRMLAHYGGPAALAADAQAAARVTRWGGRLLAAAKATAVVASAGATAGVRQGVWDERQLREQAEQTRAARREVARCKRQLQRLVQGHPVLEAQGRVIGAATACVLWARLGDPRAYHCAEAYRKALGLNLTERSSGTHQGELRISKRGQPQPRQWLYLATLRLLQQAGVQSWYQAKKARDGNSAKRAVVAVMRKLALALYHVGVHGSRFEARRLFAKQADRSAARAADGGS